MTVTRSTPSTTSRRSSTADAPGRRERILVRGVTLLRLALLAAVLLLLAPLSRRATPGLAATLLAFAALGAGAGARTRWWVLRIDRDQLDDALARSCRMVRAVSVIADDGVRVQLARATLTIRIHAVRPRVFQLRFPGDWRDHPKAVLLRSVLAKQFATPVPRIRIRLRSNR